jgi:hypothetical protein
MAILADKRGRVAGAARAVHTGSGYLAAVIVSHAESATQTVTFFDGHDTGGDVILVLQVASQRSPMYLAFSSRYPVRFDHGLTVDPGNCEVFVILEGTGR